MTLKQIAEKANQIKTIIGLSVVIIGWGITIGVYKNKIENVEKELISFQEELKDNKMILDEELINIESSFEKSLIEIASRNVEVKSLLRSHQIRYEELLTKVQYRK